MKIKNILGVLLVLLICCAGTQAQAFTVIDPFPTEFGTVVANFRGQVYVGINDSFTRWPATFSPEGSVFDYELPLSDYTFTRDIQGYFGTSSINTTQGFLSSEVYHPGPSLNGVGSSVTVLTMSLPTSGFFTMSDNPHTVSSAMALQVISGTQTLGEIGFFMDNNNLSWQVNSWAKGEPEFPWMPPSDIITPLYAGQGELDFSKMGSYVQEIINDRSTEYYYMATVGVYSQTRYDYGRAYGQLNFSGSNANAVPEPGTLLLFGIGGVGLALRRRFQKNA